MQFISVIDSIMEIINSNDLVMIRILCDETCSQFVAFLKHVRHSLVLHPIAVLCNIGILQGLCHTVAAAKRAKVVEWVGMWHLKRVCGKC